ncbi:MAG: cyanophycinase [Rubrivivax sp.]|nr:MAG: cyanophycinase [Rubrivivax sp.]
MPAEQGARTGALVPIGGNEDRKGDKTVLKAVLETTGVAAPRVAVVTAASQVPGSQWNEYEKAFGNLGAEAVWLDVRDRAAASSDAVLDEVRRAHVLFMTGGDQERLTGLLHGTALHRLASARYRDEGLTIAGTSAGASAIAAWMPCAVEVQGAGLELCGQEIPQGLAFVSGIVIDQHFTQRDRLSRLIGFACSRGGLLGFGIDEDTAMVMRPGSLHVVGQGTVTAVDCRMAAPGGSQAKVPSLRNVALYTMRTGARIEAGPDDGGLSRLLP